IDEDDDHKEGDTEIKDTHLRTRGLWRLPRELRRGDTGRYTIWLEGADSASVPFGKTRARQGWMHPVTIHFVEPPGDPKLDRHTVVDLTDVPPATTEAGADFDRRIA